MEQKTGISESVISSDCYSGFLLLLAIMPSAACNVDIIIINAVDQSMHVGYPSTPVSG